jgi:putative ABC transport system permease protein
MPKHTGVSIESNIVKLVPKCLGVQEHELTLANSGTWALRHSGTQTHRHSNTQTLSFMNLIKIVCKNMRQRALATCLTTLSVALGVALCAAILLIRQEMQKRFEQGAIGYEMVVGAKGSPLQLVLNTVFHLDISPGNIPWDLFTTLRDDRRVKLAIPFAVGDNYRGFRIVGTTDALFREFEFEPGRKFAFAQGGPFQFSEEALEHAFEEAAERAKAAAEGKTAEPHDHDRVSEAVLGSAVAAQTGLKLGNTFVASHGLQEAADEKVHGDVAWKVVGILAPTGTANDRAIFINLDSFYHIEGHEIRETGKPLDDDTTPPGMVSSIVLKLRTPVHALGLAREINDSLNAMAAFPASEIRNLFQIVGNIDRVLLAQAILIVIVAGVAIAVSIYNSLSERRREIAILRALGARRRTIFAIVVWEAVAICLLGGVAGLLGGHAIVTLANVALQEASGFTVAAFRFQTVELLVLAGCVILGALSGFGPAARAYRTDVAENLAPTT